jgi:hypothetical protein
MQVIVIRFRPPVSKILETGGFSIRTSAVASGFGPLIPHAGATGCHIPSMGGPRRPMRKA